MTNSDHSTHAQRFRRNSCRRARRVGALLATAALPAVAFAWTATAQDAVELREIVVETEGTGGTSPVGPGEGYIAKQTTTGSKAPRALRDIPQSVSVVTRQQMDDRQPAQIEDALAYTPGVTPSIWGVDDRFNQFLIRGFDIGSTGIFRDGLSQKVIDFSGFKIEPYAADRIEVLKGPVGVLYGENDAGGMVNIITKRPVFESFYEGYGGYGSLNTFEGAFDIGGAIDKDKTWAYRLTGLYRDGATEVDGSENDRAFIAPALTWQPDARTTLTFLTNLQADKLTPNSFLPAAGLNYAASYGQLPEDFVYSQHAFNKFDASHGAFGYQFEHAFNNASSVRQNLRFAAQDTDYGHLYFNGMVDATTMDYVAFTVDQTAKIFNVDNQAQFDAEYGAIDNTLLVGADYSRYWVDGKKGWANGYRISILNPHYNFAVADPAIYQDGVQTIERVGLYAQDQARIYDRWLLTLGLRHSWIKNDYDDHLFGADTSQTDTAWSTMAGLGYDFDIGVTPYASYSESFVTNTGSTFFGTLHEPSKARQYEAGIKYAPTFFNGFFTAAVFDITKTNVLTSDPAHPGFQVQTGEVNHRGLELEGNFDLGFGLSVTAGYTWLDASITESNDGDIGNRPARVPEHQAALWADYKVPSGPLEGLSFGAGVRYIGESFGDNANLIKVSGYELVDTALRYEKRNFAASINVTNLFDNDYFATCATGAGCIRGEGRVVKGRLSVKF